MADDETELFLREMADVRPLAQEHPTSVGEKPLLQTPGHEYRRVAAQRNLPSETSEPGLSTAFVEPVSPEAIISFKREGIQHGVYRRLQRGLYDIEASLDLHGLTIEEARHEVERFINQCIDYEVRMALLSHGKGHRNKDRIPWLKSYLVRWLPSFPDVMAYHSAQKWHGGAGAVYVLLRKSQRAKARTLENMGLRSATPGP